MQFDTMILRLHQCMDGINKLKNGNFMEKWLHPYFDSFNFDSFYYFDSFDFDSFDSSI